MRLNSIAYSGTRRLMLMRPGHKVIGCQFRVLGDDFIKRVTYIRHSSTDVWIISDSTLMLRGVFILLLFWRIWDDECGFVSNFFDRWDCDCPTSEDEIFLDIWFLSDDTLMVRLN